MLLYTAVRSGGTKSAGLRYPHLHVLGRTRLGDASKLWAGGLQKSLGLYGDRRKENVLIRCMGVRPYSSQRNHPQRRVYRPQHQDTTTSGKVLSKSAQPRPRENGQREKRDGVEIDWLKIFEEAFPFIVGYTVVTLLIWGATTVVWFANRDHVAITGRRRYAARVPDPVEPLTQGEIEALEEVRRLNPEAFGTIERVFARVVAAAGMEDRDWDIYLVPGPGELLLLPNPPTTSAVKRNCKSYTAQLTLEAEHRCHCWSGSGSLKRAHMGRHDPPYQ